MRELDTSKYRYEFVGGPLNGKVWHYAALEIRGLIDGYSPDRSAQRAQGRLCARAELDNQPIVKGYYGPMYNGKLYLTRDGLKTDCQCTEAERLAPETMMFHAIRYEAPEVYARMSN